jgi:hypothetical protein
MYFGRTESTQFTQTQVVISKMSAVYKFVTGVYELRRIWMCIVCLNNLFVDFLYSIY